MFVFIHHFIWIYLFLERNLEVEREEMHNLSLLIFI